MVRALEESEERLEGLLDVLFTGNLRLKSFDQQQREVLENKEGLDGLPVIEENF